MKTTNGSLQAPENLDDDEIFQRAESEASFSGRPVMGQLDFWLRRAVHDKTRSVVTRSEERTETESL